MRTSGVRFQLVCCALAMFVSVAGSASAQSQHERRQLCAHYRAAWIQAVNRAGADGLGFAFVKAHDAYLSRGCTSRRDVCPRSPHELDIANRLTLQAIEGDMPRRMLPFGCAR